MIKGGVSYNFCFVDTMNELNALRVGVTLSPAMNYIFMYVCHPVSCYKLYMYLCLSSGKRKLLSLFDVN